MLKSLVTYAAIKKEAEFIKSKNPKLYHNPLLVTIANRVHTLDAELKIFFQVLASIAKGGFDLKTAKDDLAMDFLQNKDCQFSSTSIDNTFIQIIQSITESDILKYVFNASQTGSIEITRIVNNSRELAFKLTSSEKHFCLLVASDAVAWQDNILDDYQFVTTPLTKSYFNEFTFRISWVHKLFWKKSFSKDKILI